MVIKLIKDIQENSLEFEVVYKTPQKKEGIDNYLKCGATFSPSDHDPVTNPPKKHRSLRQQVEAQMSRNKKREVVHIIYSNIQYVSIVCEASCHQVIRSSGHQVIRSSGRQVIRSSGHQVIRSPCHYVIMSSVLFPMLRRSHTYTNNIRTYRYATQTKTKT